MTKLANKPLLSLVSQLALSEGHLFRPPLLFHPRHKVLAYKLSVQVESA